MLYIYNDKFIKYNNKCFKGFKSSHLPDETDFVYLANNYVNNVGIPNLINDSLMGTYGIYQNNNLNKIGEGKDCYLTNDSSDNKRLQMEISNEQMNYFKAENGTYTFFIRVYGTVSTGGVFSWRTNGGYNYMIRTTNKLQIHGSSGVNTLDLIDGNVIKIEIAGAVVTVTDLDNDNTQTVNIGTSRSMGNTMTTFYAGYSGEHYLDKMYGLAGIHRATTAEEDEMFRKVLHNQSL